MDNNINNEVISFNALPPLSILEIVDLFNQSLKNIDKKIPDTDSLSYESLNYSNSKELLNLFSADDNEFIEPFYKDEKLLCKHLDFLSAQKEQNVILVYSWLLTIKNSSQYVGVIEIFQLSQNSENSSNKERSIRVAIAKNYRRKKYGTQAVGGLLKYIQYLKLGNEINLFVDVKNIPAQLLLKKKDLTHFIKIDIIPNLSNIFLIKKRLYFLK